MKKYNFFFCCLLSLFLVNCESDSSDIGLAESSTTGVGGSLARFAIIGDYLYVIDNLNLSTLDISDPAAPTLVAEPIPVTQGVETIFPLNNYLFLGTQDGMYIYEIMADGIPNFVSTYQHVVSCDPVVANTEYAYVTLRVSDCRQAGIGAANLLEVIDINNIENPQIVGSYELEAPRGLGLDGDVLFVCQGDNGLRVYSTANPLNLQEITHLPNINAFDVIPLGGLLIVVGPDKLIQLDYTDINDIKVVSEISTGV
jgi:hypothetical protein